MKMNKKLMTALALTAALCLFTSCAGKPVSQSDGQGGDDSAGGEGALKTGLSIVTGMAKSKDAEADADGVIQSDISIVAVTVDDNGVIEDCVIDAVQCKIGVTYEGKLSSDIDMVFPSKNELGRAYGLAEASAIGREWNEQMETLAEYARGKTVAQLREISVNESGAPSEGDLASGVTLAIGGYIDGIELAVKNASHLGAGQGDRLALTSIASMAKSKDAEGDEEGLAQAYVTIAAVTFSGDRVSSCHIDAVQTNVNYNAAGAITTDLGGGFPSKNELGAEYGLAGASSIGKEWNEQAAAFCEYTKGKTVSEIMSIAVDEKGAPADGDLASSVTVGIGGFQTLIEKAG